MLNLAIVEDSQENIDILQYMLAKSNRPHQVIGVAKTMGEAELLLTRPDLHLALLDIQLKEGTIFDVLDKIQKKGRIGFDTVFVTAHGSYENALKAIQFACMDFINKPIDQEELNTILTKVDAKNEVQQQDQQIKHLIDLINNQSALPSTIGIVLSKGVIEFVTIDDIVYFEADQSICRIHFHDQKKLTSAKHLGYYLDLLSDHPHFVQSSKSHFVNLMQIKQYDHRERTMRFENGGHLVASFRYSKEVRKRLLERQANKGFLGGRLGRLSDWFK